MLRPTPQLQTAPHLHQRVATRFAAIAVLSRRTGLAVIVKRRATQLAHDRPQHQTPSPQTQNLASKAAVKTCTQSTIILPNLCTPKRVLNDQEQPRMIKNTPIVHWVAHPRREITVSHGR